MRALLFPATKQELSEARLTDRMGMSPAGVWSRNEDKAQGMWEVKGGNTYKFMSASVLSQIPLFDPACLVAGDQFTLVWVHDDIVD